MKQPQPKTRYQAIISAILTIAMVFSLVPSQAIAEAVASVNETQTPVEQTALTNDATAGTTNTSEGQNGSDVAQGSDATKDPQAGGEQTGDAQQTSTSQSEGTQQLVAAQQPAATPQSEGVEKADEEKTPEDEPAIVAEATDVAATANGLNAKAPSDIKVSVGLPSESNVKQDLHVALTYNDKFFEQASSTFNNDLAYASTCLAAAADNSNEGGNNYSLKSKNIVSYLQQIGCQDVRANDGYNYKPMEKANIGVAIGYKDILVNNTTYRLFVFAARGGGYEEEWAVNMRVGTEGDATGFQEARDGAIGFIMPYIKEHTDGLDGNVNVKIWGSGYCRGGTTVNMTFGWLNKWIYERNNGSTYNGLAYTQNYNADHSVMGAAYSQSDMRYTQAVSFSPKKEDGYLASNVSITNDDLYCYPVNCPFGADGTDVANYEGLMTGIHNLINPDDWFPQVIMDWWGFKRYGYTHDHDITGTYTTDGDLHKRDKSVWDPSNPTRMNAVNDMIIRLKAVDSSTAFNSTYFRQHYFSKASVITNTAKKVGKWFWNKIKKIWGDKKEDPLPDIFQISVDEKGEGNQFYSKGKELKYNQGGYYQEFMKFLLNSAGFPDDAAGARKHYVNNYQDAFIDLMDWVCGQPLEIREKLPKVASGQIKAAFKQMQDDGVKELKNANSILGSLGMLTTTTVGTYIAYVVAVVWSVNDSSANLPADLISRTLKLTFNNLGVKYTDSQVLRASKALGKLAYGFYDKEQGIAKFCFFHALTMYKAGGSIAQSHWPEQSLAWFAQCKPVDPSKKPKTNAKAEAEAGAAAMAEATVSDVAGNEAIVGTEAAPVTHFVYTYFDDDPEYLYDQGTRENGEIIGVVDTTEHYNDEDVVISSWNMYDLLDLDPDAEPLKAVTEDYQITADDPENIVLVPNDQSVDSKHVRLWLNKAMTGFDRDVLIGEFDVFDGGYHYIAYTPLPEGVSEDGFDVLYYGDNENLVTKEGVSLQGWVNESEDEMIGFLPDDFIDYEQLPEGDIVDLYAAWLDPLVYNIQYHANRSESDGYIADDAQLASDDSTLVVNGLSADDEGMQNDGKTFVGWNTEADGSGIWFANGQQATLEQLDLGDRAQYTQDLQELADLQAEEAPAYNTEEDEWTAADEREAMLEAKYTADLYAQWATPATPPASNPSPSTSSTTTNVARAATPHTGDSMSMQVAMLVLLAAGVSLCGARRLRRER